MLKKLETPWRGGPRGIQPILQHESPDLVATSTALAFTARPSNQNSDSKSRTFVRGPDADEARGVLDFEEARGAGYTVDDSVFQTDRPGRRLDRGRSARGSRL